MTKEHKKLYQLAVRMDEDMHALVEAFAKDNYMNKVDVVRKALRLLFSEYYGTKRQRS